MTDSIDPIPITGMGLTTPLGLNVQTNWSALCDGQTLTDRPDRTYHARPTRPDPAADLVQHIGSITELPAPGDLPEADRSVSLAAAALRQATARIALDSQTPLPMLMAVSKGTVHAWQQAATDPHRPETAAAVSLGPMDLPAVRLAERFNVRPVKTIVAACASSMLALHHARHLMHENQWPRMAVLTVESALLPMLIHSYRRLGVLAPLQSSQYQARPLSNDRHGFVLCEAAGCIVLDRNADREQTLAWLEDSAIACETHHLMQSAPDRPALRHITGQLIRPDRPIDLLHPHATGTPDNDQSELQVYGTQLQQTQPDHLPPVYACKGAIGHGLGAAGLSAVILAVCAAMDQLRPPMPWLQSPMPCPLPLSDDSLQMPIHRQALFAAGFGGHVGGVVIRTDH